MPARRGPQAGATALAVLLLAAACDPDRNQPEPQLQPCEFQLEFPYFNQPILLVGDTGRLMPGRTLGGLTNPTSPVVWSSSDPSVAQVDDGGLVTGTGPGFAEISANGCYGYSVEVVSRPAVIELRPNPLAMLPGNSGLIEYVFRDAGGAAITSWILPQLVSVMSESGSIVTVVPDPAYPTVRALAEGTGTVRATLGEAGGTLTVLVAGVTLGVPDAGADHTCALSADSLGYCWGNLWWLPRDINAPGALSGPAPIPLPGGLRFVTLETGANYACGVTADRDLYCLGDGQTGQLGVEEFSNGPVRVPLPDGVADLSVGPVHTCAVIDDGRTFCWGSNVAGELGNPSTSSCWFGLPVKSYVTPVACGRTPQEVGQGLAFASVHAGSALTCGRTTAGATYCWGLHYGQTPTLVDDSLGLDSLTLGGQFFVAAGDTLSLACGLDPTGAAWCWGRSRFGLGDGSTTESWSPVPVAGGLTFRTLGAGYGACGVTAADELYCWGGPESFARGATPTPVPGTNSFTTVTAGMNHGCARATDDRIYCWGANDYSQLGVEGSAGRAVPIRVLGQQ